MPAYLVERYWPGVTTDRLREALERGRRVMEEMNGQGHSMRDISCTLLPGEEVVFSVYEGSSAIAVQQLNERAGFPFSSGRSRKGGAQREPLGGLAHKSNSSLDATVGENMAGAPAADPASPQFESERLSFIADDAAGQVEPDTTRSIGHDTE